MPNKTGERHNSKDASVDKIRIQILPVQKITFGHDFKNMVINNERNIAQELFEMNALLASYAQSHLANEFVFVIDLLLPNLDQKVVVFQRNGHHTGSSIDHGNRDILVPSWINTLRHHVLGLDGFICKRILARILKSHGLSLRTANIKNVITITEFREL